MHKEVKDYIEKIKLRFPDKFKDVSVLEFGSLNVNGTPRFFFDNCFYVGVDKIAGEGVDIVSNAHEYETDERFDVVITTEMLEHDENAEKSIQNALRLLKDGGLFIGTAANVNREPHYAYLNYGNGVADEYYKNISREFLENIGIKDIEEDNKQHDIRFIWQKPIL